MREHAAGALPAMQAQLPINEIFESLQGEGSLTGSPAMFVRLQGCTVGCPWCDTKYTWPLDPAEAIAVSGVLAKERESASYAFMDVATIAKLATGYQARLVVITGGEPCAHDLRALTSALLAAGKRVQVETSGTELPRVPAEVFVTVSPKLDMPGGRVVLAEAVCRANEIKMPVGHHSDVTALQRLLHSTGARAPVFLQPLSRSPKATRLCIDAATRFGWRVSIQTHAYLGLR